MKRKAWIGSFVALLASAGAVSAGPVDFSRAEDLAREFYEVQRFAQAKSLPDFTCVYPERGEKGGNAPYYIFNVGDDQGFVIVSGDDNTRSLVLGYSDKGRFELENMPGNIRSWLEFYEHEVERAARSSFMAAHPKDFVKGDTVVAPLLGGISYNQGYPYNVLCPEDPQTGQLSVTGCVATALASIAKYYEYPLQGKGLVDYQSGSLHIEADLSESHYDWDNILDSYNGDISSYTEEQINAAGLLLRDCGYASSMAYSSTSSGATTDPIFNGIVDHLGFDSLVSLRYRDFYDTQEEWEDMLRSALDNGQPLYYQGQSSGGGHAFICDGYTDAGFFHINWGWGGSNDGYFIVSVMDPGDYSGIGAGTGGGYAELQSVFFNMVPQGRDLVDDVYFLYASSGLRVNRWDVAVDSLYAVEQPFDVTVGRIQNYNMARFDGEVALALYQDTDFVAVVTDEQALTVNRYGSASVPDLSVDLQGVEDGLYEMWAVFRAGNADRWTRMYAYHELLDEKSYLPVRVQDGQYKLEKIAGTLQLDVECPVSRRMTLDIKQDGKLVSTVQISSTGDKVDLLYGTYDFAFWLRDFDTTYINGFNFTNDTAIQVVMNQILLAPYVQNVRVSYDTALMMWLPNHPSQQLTTFPTNYIVYLDSVAVDTVGADDRRYTFFNVPLGVHQAGLRSIFAGGVSDMSTWNFRIRQTAGSEDAELFQDVRVSPNPSRDGVFHIETGQACILHVCNLAGSALSRQELAAGDNRLDLSSFAPGYYLLRFGDGGQARVIKVLKL